MNEKIEVYHQDMETYLEPEEYQAFLKAKQEGEEFLEKYRDYKIKKSINEKGRDECQKRRDGAKSDYERLTWDIEIAHFMVQAMKPAPYKPTQYFKEHDHYLELVRKRKLKHLEEEQRKEAEEQAERQHEEERKQAEQQAMLIAMRTKKVADSEWEEFEKTFNSAIKNLKHQLANPKSPKLALGCSSEVLNYRPELWGGIDLPSDDEVKIWAEPQIMERIPEVLRDIITWSLTHQTFVVPKAEYCLIGVPCLVWDFDIYVAAKVDLWLEESTITKQFHGLKYFVEIKTEKIGSFFLKAQRWDSQEGLKTPLALLALLAEGKLEASGITVEFTMSDPVSTIYSVAGFEESDVEYYYITVEEEFRRFIEDICKEQSLGQGLLARGIIRGGTAKLIEAKWNEPLSVSGKAGDAGGVDLENVVAKLMELGWTAADAKKKVETTTFPNNATTEEMVSIILGKSY